MTDKKLTDNEIVKALERFIERIKNSKCDFTDYCNWIVFKNALDLINRLQAENERLKSPFVKMYEQLEDKIKAEAYKECIEKVKALFPSDNEPYQYWEIHEGADNLLKELVGEDNAE